MSLNDERRAKNLANAVSQIVASTSDEELDEMVAEGIFDSPVEELSAADLAKAERARQVLLAAVDQDGERDTTSKIHALQRSADSHNAASLGTLGTDTSTGRRRELGDHRISRRGFFKAGAAFSLVAAAAARNLPNAFISRSSARASKDLIEQVKPAVGRIDFLQSLLRPAGRLVGIPGGGRINPERAELAKWQAWKNIGFPNDRAALDAYAIFAQDMEVVDDDQLIDVPNEVSIVTTGSPAANQISQLYIPYRDENGEDKIISRTFAPECVPYGYVFCAETRLRRVPGSDMLSRAPHKGISTKQGTLIADTSGEVAVLRKDFLLISRLPRNPGSPASIVNAGGGYGPGTEALKLLFDRNAFPDEEVRELERLLGGAQYFQVAFLCDIGDSGDPRNLRIWDKCPPLRIAPEDLRAPCTSDERNDDPEGDSHLLPTWSPPEK